MNRKPEIRIYKGGFIRDEVKSLNPRSRKEDKLLDWQGTSDREESLSDPRWHKRPPTKKKATTTATETTQAEVKDATELLSSRPPKKNFPTIVFTKETSPAKQHVLKTKTSQAVQTDNRKVLVGTQTDASEERPEMQDQFVSRINYNIPSQQERAPNEEPPTMTRTQPEATQLEASHHEITEGIAATVNQTTIAETEEDTPLFRKRLQRILGATK